MVYINILWKFHSMLTVKYCVYTNILWKKKKVLLFCKPTHPPPRLKTAPHWWSNNNNNNGNNSINGLACSDRFATDAKGCACFFTRESSPSHTWLVGQVWLIYANLKTTLMTEHDTKEHWELESLRNMYTLRQVHYFNLFPPLGL